MSRTRIGAALLCTVATLSVHAGKLEKAFAALEVKNYFLAKELFHKQVKSHPAAAWYGLSVIAGRADNPFYQLDSSYAYVERAGAAFTSTSDKERTYIAKSGVTSQAITTQREHVFGIAWNQTTTDNTIGAYQKYIDRYPNSGQVKEAGERRDQMAFQAARETNTAQAYQAFIDRYPNARMIYEARSRLQEATFRELVQRGTEEEYVRFIAAHPESPYVANAQDSIYHITTPHRSPEELRVFIRRHTNNRNVPNAWRALYAVSTKDLSAASITQFLQENPDYPFVTELSEDYRTASLVLYPFKQNGAWGYIDDTGVERVKARFEFAEAFMNGQAQVGLGGHVGTMNKSGELVIEPEYDDVLDFSEGLATVERDEKAGAVDRTGKIVVPMQFDELGEYSGGLAFAVKDGKYGYVDATGHEAIPFQFEGANTFKRGTAVVKYGGQQGVIDARGNVIVPFRYDWVEGFEQPVSRVRKDGRVGLISPFGDVIVPVEHEHIGPFNDGLALVIDNGRCGYIDVNGNMVIAQQFEASESTPGWGDFHNGVARVVVTPKNGSKENKVNLIDTQGEKIFPSPYADVGLMESGVVPVKKKAKWGYASRAFATVAEAKYDQAWEFRGGYARIRAGDLFGLVDSAGKETVAPKYMKLLDTANGWYIATEATGTGIVDAQGKVIVPLVFGNVTVVDGRMAMVNKGERSAYITLPEGRFIWKEIGFDAPQAPAPEASPK